ncbi:MAG: hypothetical protein ABIK95_01670 [Acidobacteriota bacterium]
MAVAIMNDLSRGATAIEGRGLYSDMRYRERDSVCGADRTAWTSHFLKGIMGFRWENNGYV